MQTTPETAVATVNTTVDTLGATSMMDILLIAMFIGSGVYLIYSYIIQRRTNTLLANKMICPGSCDVQKCLKPEEFIKFILPRALILGIALLIFGGLFILEHFYGSGDALINIVLMILPLAMFGWYVHEQRKAIKLFW